MFDHYRKNHFSIENKHKYNYGNHSHYYAKEAIHYDSRYYLYHDYNSYSNANSYDYDCPRTCNSTKFCGNSYEVQSYSTHLSFVPQNTSLYSRSSDLYSTPYNDQVANTLLEFIRETLEEIRISHKNMEEMKLEIENLKSEKDMEMIQYNSKFHAREDKLSNLPLENSQT